MAFGPREKHRMNFADMGLAPEILRALADASYETATEVQQQAVPPAIAGRDLMVASSTGSGKTASFMIPALQRVLASRQDPEVAKRDRRRNYGPRVLVLAPTRELAMQVAKAASTYGRHVQGLRVATVVGGVPYAAQLRALQGPLDILIATPGRLLDHLNSGKAVLDHVDLFVLDEADRMLDMGFIEDIQTIADRVPAQRQTVMYSATFLGHVGRLAQQLMKDALKVEITSHTDTHANIEQRLHWADNNEHKNALLDHILTGVELEQAVVFTSTQRDADWLADRLADMGHSAAALHGGMPQGRRTRVLQGLRQKQLRVLVATDVAARGIDVPTISHVINYGLPMKAEDYVHRIGRTGRAGRNGLAITLAERMDVGMIRRIQHFTTQDIPVQRIEGLEPRMQEPQIFRARPEGFARGPGAGRPSGPGNFGRRDARPAPWRDGPRPGGFDRSAGPRGGGFDRAPFERVAAERPPFEGRELRDHAAPRMGGFGGGDAFAARRPGFGAPMSDRPSGYGAPAGGPRRGFDGPSGERGGFGDRRGPAFKRGPR